MSTTSIYKVARGFGDGVNQYVEGQTVEFDDELAKRYGPDYLTPSTQSVDDVVRTKQVTDSDTKTKTTKRGRRKT
jgi:hypothetical protein